MATPVVLTFGPFRLDPADASLRRGAKRLPLTPKDFAVLQELVAHPGQLVTKEAMLRAVWPDTRVGDAVLKVSIRRVRRVLGDRPDSPRFVETVHRRGYRFIATVSTASTAPQRRSAHPGPHTPGPVPGRETELDRLAALAEQASAGERQVVFISGEPGIGKTTVLETFLHRLSADARARIARGQCVEHFGPGEAYGPALDALQRACRGPHAKEFVGLLQRRAPTWLSQVPALRRRTKREVLRPASGAGRDRMLREFVDAVLGLAAATSRGGSGLFVLALEDLQWSDPSTLDLLGALTQGQDPARLLVLGTHRPVGELPPGHPLRRLSHELRLHGRCVELALEGISEAAVTQYLGRRLQVEPPLDSIAPAARLLKERTEGHPLFLVNVVEDWLADGVIRCTEGHWTLPQTTADVPRRVPRTLQGLVEEQSERLVLDEQHVLAAASVVGPEFSAPAVAAALDVDVLKVEECCAGLVRRQSFVGVVGGGHRPDRRRAGRYRFLHALYQEAWYDSLTPAQRARTHHRIGEWAEGAYGERAGEHAAELAMHFERSDDHARARHYHERAAENAQGRYAYREAADHLAKALAELRAEGAPGAASNVELELQLALGNASSAARGFADPAVVSAYSRAWELARGQGGTAAVFPALCGLSTFYVARADLPTAREVGEQLVVIARDADDPGRLVQALVRLGLTVYLQGEFALAETYTEEGLALYDPARDRELAAAFGQDPAVVGLGSGASISWLLGYPVRAEQQTRRQLRLARELAHPSTLAYALYSAAAISVQYRDAARTRELADELITLSSKQGFAHWMARAGIYRGWSRVALGEGESGITEMRHGIAAARATGAEMWQPYFRALLAGALGKIGQLREAFAMLAEAFAAMESTDQRVVEAEMYRLRGELELLASRQEPTRAPRETAQRQAERCFQKAIAVARQRHARSFELRAATSLARLWSRQGRRAPARQMLLHTYDGFTEGFDTEDLREAAALLAELA